MRGRDAISKTIATLIIAVIIVAVAGGIAVYYATLPTGPVVKEVKIGLVVPLTGPWALQGMYKKQGAELAIEEINAAGGIKSLGGAKLVLVVTDAGTTAESAASAAERLITTEGIVAGIGAWLSSFTLAVTEVAERYKVPWFTLSYADSITKERGFKYVFQTSAYSSDMAVLALDMLLDLAKAQGVTIKRIALVGDNTAAIVLFMKPLRELIPAKGLEIVTDQVFTPPLADATPIALAVKAAKPDAIFYGATSFPDSTLILRKFKELGITLPIIGVGAWLTTPEYVAGVGADLMEGIMSVTGSHLTKGWERLEEKYVAKYGKPFMIQDVVSTYAHVWIIKEALEKAGTIDRTVLRDTISKIHITSGPATILPGGSKYGIQFNAEGHRIVGDRPAYPVIVQWQGGKSWTVWPLEDATRPVKWPGK
jgi:branched-chain amino acid transport system substrate-binding protein